MKVLHVITGLGRGGAEAMLVKLLGASGGDHAVASMTGRGAHADEIEALGVPVHNLGMPPGLPDPRGLLRLRRIVREFDPDVIHGWMYHASLLSLLAVTRQPVIVAIHHSLDDIENEKYKTRSVIAGLALLSRKSRAIVYCSATCRKQHEDLGFERSLGLVIPNGFETATFRPDPALREDIRRELMIGEDRFVILHAARFHPVKNHAGMLEAARSLWSDQRYLFLLAGKGVTADNPALAPCLHEAPPDSIRLLGERDDMGNLMAGADICCVSSLGEAFPLVLGEAMACGLPCVTTDVGDAAYIVQDTGIVVPPRNSEALAAAIRRLAALSTEERAESARRARGRIVESFSLESVMAAYGDLYECTLREWKYMRRH